MAPALPRRRLYAGDSVTSHTRCNGRRPRRNRFEGMWNPPQQLHADSGDHVVLFANGFEGQGQMAFNNGDVYDGQWKDNKMHGKGKLTYANGDVYEGDWKDDKKHGFGIYTWSDGRTYSGHWCRGKQHGLGTYSVPG